MIEKTQGWVFQSSWGLGEIHARGARVQESRLDSRSLGAGLLYSWQRVLRVLYHLVTSDHDLPSGGFRGSSL